MRIETIYRYPVKGLTAEALEEVTLTPGETLPEDRRFALVQGDEPLSALERQPEKHNAMLNALKATVRLIEISMMKIHITSTTSTLQTSERTYQAGTSSTTRRLILPATQLAWISRTRLAELSSTR